MPERAAIAVPLGLMLWAILDLNQSTGSHAFLGPTSENVP